MIEKEVLIDGKKKNITFKMDEIQFESNTEEDLEDTIDLTEALEALKKREKKSSQKNKKKKKEDD